MILKKFLFDTPVQEKYVGGNHSELKTAQQALDRMIEEISMITPQRMNEGPSIVRNINAGKDMKIFQESMRKFFGLRNLNMFIDYSPIPNAYTPCDTFVTNKKVVIKDGKRTMDDEIYVVIHSALIMVSNFNSREVMAVILHEIGHNFVDSPSHILSRILNFSIGSLLVAPQAVFMEMMVSMGLFGAFDVINFKKIFFKAKELVNKTTLKFPFVANTLYLLADLQFNVSYLTSLFSFRLDLIPRILMFGSIGRMVYTYDIEKASDSFAVDHGYGPDLATGLDKLMMMEKSFNGQMASKVKPYGLLVDVLEIQMETVSSIFSGYPSKQNRIRSLLDRAESNLAKDKSLSPTQKKQLQKDIKDMETFYYDQYLNIESDRNKHRYLSVVTANMIEHMYKGKADIRELFFNPDKR